ncbi:MAG: hypothetical protein WC857_02470 [Candidatus Paceibacterota bacterium]
MSKKTTWLFPFCLTIISIFINPYILGLCIQSDKYCIFGSLAHSVGKPMFYFSLTWLVLSLVFLLISNLTFQRWLKFTYIWVPLTILLVFLSPEYDSSLFSMSRDVVSLFMSVLFLIISFLIILISYLKTPKNQ